MCSTWKHDKRLLKHKNLHLKCTLKPNFICDIFIKWHYWKCTLFKYTYVALYFINIILSASFFFLKYTFKIWNMMHIQYNIILFHKGWKRVHKGWKGFTSVVLLDCLKFTEKSIIGYLADSQYDNLPHNIWQHKLSFFLIG